MKNMKSGFLPMVISVLAVVLYVSMFGSIMTALTTLAAVDGISDLVALATIIGIAPTVLLLGGVFGAGLAYYKGFKASTTSDTGGLMRMVMGILVVILFITLFSTIASAFVTLNTSYGASSNTSWVAFGTVVTIVPTILFLGGIFAGIGTASSGIRTRRRSRRMVR